MRVSAPGPTAAKRVRRSPPWKPFAKVRHPFRLHPRPVFRRVPPPPAFRPARSRPTRQSGRAPAPWDTRKKQVWIIENGSVSLGGTESPRRESDTISQLQWPVAENQATIARTGIAQSIEVKQQQAAPDDPGIARSQRFGASGLSRCVEADWHARPLGSPEEEGRDDRLEDTFLRLEGIASLLHEVGAGTSKSGTRITI